MLGRCLYGGDIFVIRQKRHFLTCGDMQHMDASSSLSRKTQYPLRCKSANFNVSPFRVHRYARSTLHKVFPFVKSGIVFCVHSNDTLAMAKYLANCIVICR